MGNIIIACAAGVVLVAAAFHIIAGPFSIGENGRSTPLTYLAGVLIYVCAIILAGRALGWW